MNMPKIFKNGIKRINWWLTRSKRNESFIDFRANRNTIDTIQILDINIRQAVEEKFVVCLDIE